ncbi:MAG: urea ABC transporter substrate-binding protein [Fuerstiella sp.]|nr:urea ABC transporter substrate-binding protein [Fuerstiella sp.]MCP4857671.1 urea ABC transporter substrate-binding protein [Fuerstiella sp.]
MTRDDVPCVTRGIRKTLLGVVPVVIIAACWYCMPEKDAFGIWMDRSPIKVGVLHSLSGTMAVSEGSVVDATLLAIAEINEQGGVLGRKIEPVVVDGKSDGPTFAQGAERLIVDEKVSAVFGCWTSASRRTVKSIFEKHNHLLFYPVQYEGLEASPNIVYTGAAPNQQIIPAVKWCMDNLGSRVFLVGSDYVFPRTANAIVKDQVVALRGRIVGEEYILLGSSDVHGAVQAIKQAKPDVILNTINGDSNAAFFHELRAAGIGSQDIPVMSFSIAENELRSLPDADTLAGDYACWNYFQSIDKDENRRFERAFKTRYGNDRVTNDPMEAAYFGVHLWAQAVQEAGSPRVAKVLTSIKDQSIVAPEGMVCISGENNHTWKTVRIGQIMEDGQFDIVWSSNKPIRPVPYPVYRSRSEWDTFLQGLYVGWGNKWPMTVGQEFSVPVIANPGNQRCSNAILSCSLECPQDWHAGSCCWQWFP